MASRIENGKSVNGHTPDVASDPKYKKYALAVEKCLTTFENVHEWADFISFLTKLLKTFQAYMQFKEIPRKLMVAKRLSQCLNPALPNGVHQRTLDVYSHILAVIGPEGLRRDLPLWSSGLFPFFEYAATSVKPTLLNLYDTHYISLGEGLRPVMKAFILALLPGVEEETGEFFEKVLSILDKLSQSVSPAFFFQNMWLVLMTSPAARSPAINYLSRRIPKPTANEDLIALLGGDVGLVMRAFAAALEDEHLLVKRGILDLITQSLRMDGPVLKNATSEDKTILMRAAVSVVLRRDVSLNRRVNAWLLGSLEESSETRVAYYKTHSLQLLASTLRNEMLAPRVDDRTTRPYKIFISLLDTWEIGSALTEVLIMDALGVIDVSSIEVAEDTDGEDEMVLAAASVFERAEPSLVWKHILVSTLDGIKSGILPANVLNTLRLIFLSIRTHDEESQTVHIPLFMTNVLVAIDELLRNDPTKVAEPWLLDLLPIISAAFQLVPSAALLQWQKVASEADLSPIPQLRAKRIYSLETKIETHSLPATDCELSPLSVAWQSLIDSSIQCVSIVLRSSDAAVEATDLLISMTSVLNALVGRVHSRVGPGNALSWNATEWTSSILDCLTLDAPFELVDQAITLMVSLTRLPNLEPSFSLRERTVQRRLLVSLLHNFGPDRAAYHARAVQLFWAFHSRTSPHEIEALVTESLVTPNISVDPNAVEAFGVLWRFSDDSTLPGFQLRMPLLAVLDALRSDNPSSRRVGETWMRSSLKSYLRVLDPVILDLLNARPARTPVSAVYQGRSVRGYHYVRPFDQKAVHYTLESLLAVVRFGGQGFVRIARSSLFNRTAHPGLLALAQSAKIADPTSSYLDILMEILLMFLQSEPSPSLSPTMSANNLRIQGTVLELLQGIVARGELDAAILETTEAVIVGRLYASVHTNRLDLQNKLLHVLHSVIFAASNAAPARRGSRDSEATINSRTASNTLFVQMMIDGISRPLNRPVLQHWIDFVMMTVAQFRSLSHAVSPLCDCICRQLRLSFAEVDELVSHRGKGKAPLRWTTSDADILLLLNALERLVLLSLSKPDEASALDDEPGPSERLPTESSTGILGYVFGSENPQRLEDDHLSSRSPTFKNLQDAIRTVHSLWAILGGLETSDTPMYRSALSSVAARVRARCMKSLEHLFKVQSSEVLESLIECWLVPTVLQSSVNFKTSAIEAIDALTASAQIVVQMLCSSVTSRVVASTNRSKRLALNPTITDSDVFAFLEAYLRRLEGPITVQVWPTFAGLAKELLSSQEYKYQMFPLLKCTTVLCDKLTYTTAFEDRKSRKELQDTFIKLLDNCVLIAGRSFDQGNWLRKGLKEKEAVSSGRTSPTLQDLSDNDRADEKGHMLASPTAGVDVIEQINRFLSSDCLPIIRRILVDNDKVASVCANIVYYIINPAMKARSGKTTSVDDAAMDILAQLTKIPPAAKAWKPVISEAFNDNRFFNSPPSANQKWKPLIKGLMEADKQTINELLARMAAAPSANIFTSRETEMLLRSLNLRRLSYAVFTGERNQFLTQLPVIQERLVDILRPGVVAPIVHSEVYLCMRVLLCRLSPHNLSSFWPVIITELFRMFQSITMNPPADKSDELQLILAACKFLDLLVALQTEEFQVYQWMFITDTFDAVYRTDDSKPTSLMDLLTDVTSAIPNGGGGGGGGSELRDTPILPEANWRDTSMQRPMLRSVREISSIKDLIPFFSHISLHAYESIYSGGLVDWDAVELGLLEDLFDGW